MEVTMPTLWEAFLEDYADEIFDWSLRLTLEIFWRYCQDGSKAVDKFLKIGAKEHTDSVDVKGWCRKCDAVLFTTDAKFCSACGLKF